MRNQRQPVRAGRAVLPGLPVQKRVQVGRGHRFGFLSVEQIPHPGQNGAAHDQRAFHEPAFRDDGEVRNQVTAFFKPAPGRGGQDVGGRSHANGDIAFLQHAAAQRGALLVAAAGDQRDAVRQAEGGCQRLAHPPHGRSGGNGTRQTAFVQAEIVEHQGTPALAHGIKHQAFTGAGIVGHKFVHAHLVQQVCVHQRKAGCPVIQIALMFFQPADKRIAPHRRDGQAGSAQDGFFAQISADFFAFCAASPVHPGNGVSQRLPGRIQRRHGAALCGKRKSDYPLALLRRQALHGLPNGVEVHVADMADVLLHMLGRRKNQRVFPVGFRQDAALLVHDEDFGRGCSDVGTDDEAVHAFPSFSGR